MELARKKRPLDIELYGDSLLDQDGYVQILGYIQREDGCYMKDVVNMIKGRTMGSAVYRKLSKLERARLIRVRYDGSENFVELTTKSSKHLIGSTR